MGMGTIQNTETTGLLWLTDLHLDRADDQRRNELFESIRLSKAEAVVITGDISTARLLPLHLRELAAAASPKPVYFVLGNHDFFGSSIAVVDSVVSGVCREHANLHHLGQGEIIRLSSDTALVGHRGWADGRMGWGSRTLARNPDFAAIRDFKGLSKEDAFALLHKLGQDSSYYLRGLLPYALTCYDHVIVATHVPPFTKGACFTNKPCDWLRQPFYTNIAMGGFLLRQAQAFPSKQITVLAGHTHCAAEVRPLPNLTLKVGEARPGGPHRQGEFKISSGGILRTVA
jgi:predicted phosphohydrolase